MGVEKFLTSSLSGGKSVDESDSFLVGQINMSSLGFNFFNIIITIISFFSRFSAHLGVEFYILFVQYYSVICRPSQTTLWGGPGPRFEPGTGDLEARTLTTRPPHLLT